MAMQRSLDIRYTKYISWYYTNFLLLKLLQTFSSIILFSSRESTVRLAAILFTLYSVASFIARFFVLRAHQALTSPTVKLPSGCAVLLQNTFRNHGNRGVNYSRLLSIIVDLGVIHASGQLGFWRPGRKIAVVFLAKITGQDTGFH